VAFWKMGLNLGHHLVSGLLLASEPNTDTDSW
jgi:hypothetical protein